MRMRVRQTLVAQCCLKHALQYGNGWFLFAAAQGCHAPRMRAAMQLQLPGCLIMWQRQCMRGVLQRQAWVW